MERLDSKRRRDIHALLAAVDSRVTSLTGMPLAPTPPPAAGPRPEGSGAAAATHVPTRHRRRRWPLVAASVALGILGAWAALTHRSYGWKEFATATGEQRAFELEDGSVIHLNTGSRIAWRLSGDSREVRLLRGEALFRVHHDVGRPFRVYTSDAVIQAVGTQFNVYNRPDGTDVAVIEGRVNITPEAHPAIAQFNVPATDGHLNPQTRSVGASEEARVENGGRLSVHAVRDVSDVVAWRERRLVFRQETLDHIVAEFNRYSPRQIRLEGSEVPGRVFTGVFDADDPDSLAQVLARDTSLSVAYSDHLIVVSAR